MESLEHNCDNNSDTICHEMLVIGMYLIDLADFRHVQLASEYVSTAWPLGRY